MYNYLDTYVKAPFPKTKLREFLILTRCNVVRYAERHKIFVELGVSSHNINRQGIQDSAIQAGAFGGGRHGVQLAEYAKGSDMNRALLQGQLLQQ